MSVCTIYQTVRDIHVPRSHIQKTAEATLRVCRKYGHELSVHCVGEKKIRTLNRTYRGLDRPTDVLSFSALEGDKVGIEAAEEVGDIFLCIPYIQRQAKRLGVPYREELTRMLIHGILHAVGYDHMEKKDAEKMFSLQEAILKKQV
ncbi:MAG TPA: rRNA maturation RNase YbeY [Candidatus Kapabacteria bacterium]|nr:rRNA maturation RNase YbeY [Candidatus Kapabacteria bacterium]